MTLARRQEDVNDMIRIDEETSVRDGFLVFTSKWYAFDRRLVRAEKHGTG